MQRGSYSQTAATRGHRSASEGERSHARQILKMIAHKGVTEEKDVEKA
jgi:hypothetical protein